MSTNNDIFRVDYLNLLRFYPDGLPCEVCGRHIHHHTWTDIDRAGNTVACSEQADPFHTDRGV